MTDTSARADTVHTALPLLHQTTIDAVVGDVALATAAFDSVLITHRIVATPGTGKSSLLGSLRQALLDQTAETGGTLIRPVVVYLNGRDETGRLDVGSTFTLGQIESEIASQDERRTTETALEALVKDVSKDLIGMIPVAGQAYTVGSRVLQALEYGHKVSALKRAAAASHPATGSEVDILERAVNRLIGVGDDWKWSDGARRAPTLVFLVDDVNRAEPALNDWVASLGARVMAASGLSMSVVVMTAASAAAGDSSAIEVTDPIAGRLFEKLSDAGLDTKARTVTWTDLQAGPGSAPDAASVRDFRGWSRAAARSVLVSLLDDCPAAEREPLAARVETRLAGRPQGINPKHLEMLALAVLRRRRLGAVQDEWLDDLVSSDQSAADAQLAEILAGEMSLELASVLSVLVEAGGRCLPTVLERTVRLLTSRGGQEALDELIGLGVVERLGQLAISEEPLVALVARRHAADVRAHLGRLKLSQADVRHAYLKELGAELSGALRAVPDLIAPAAVPAFLDRLREIGIPDDLTRRELGEVGVPGLAAALLLSAGPGADSAGRVEELLQVGPDHRDATWCQIVAALLQPPRLQNDTVMARGWSALIGAAERQALTGYAVDAVLRACLRSFPAVSQPLAAPATALVLELAGRELRAAHLLLRHGSTDNLGRQAAALLTAHLLGSGNDPATLTARIDLARFRAGAGQPAAALELLEPVVGTGLDACLAYAEVLTDAPALATDGDRADPSVERVTATLRAHARDHAMAAVRLVRLENDLADDKVLTLLRPHLVDSAPATEDFLRVLGDTPTEVNRRAALRAAHRHARALPLRDVALAMARLARSPQERQAARVYVHSAIDDPLVAATMLARSDLEPVELERVVDVLRRSADDDPDDIELTRDAAFKLLSAPGQRARPGVLRALHALNLRNDDVVAWAREKVDAHSDPWAVLIVADALWDGQTSGDHGPDAQIELRRVSAFIIERIKDAEQRSAAGERVPDVVFDLCSRMVGVVGLARNLAPEDQDLIRLLRKCADVAVTFLSRNATDYPWAAFHTLRRSHRDLDELMERVYRAHSTEPRVLGELVLCGARTGRAPDGDVFWAQLCGLAASNQRAAQVLLNVIRTTVRESKTMELHRAEAGVRAVLGLAQMDVGLALRALSIADRLDLPVRSETLNTVLEHAPSSVRAAEAALKQLRKQEAPGRIDPVTARLLLPTALRAPHAARSYVTWLTRGRTSLPASDLEVLRRLRSRTPEAAVALLQRGTGLADAFQALDALSGHARRARYQSGQRPDWVSRDWLPSALAALATGAGARVISVAWARDAAHDRRVALWLCARSSSPASRTRPDTPGIEASLRRRLVSDDALEVVADLRELAARPDLAPVELFDRLLSQGEVDEPGDPSGASAVLVEAVGRRAPVDPAIAGRAVDAAWRARPGPVQGTEARAKALRWAMRVARLLGSAPRTSRSSELRQVSTQILQTASEEAGDLSGVDLAELLTVLDDGAAEHLWRTQVPGLLVDDEKRAEALRFARSRLGSHRTLDALAVLIEPDETARDVYTEHVVRHLAALDGPGASGTWVASVMALCATRLSLTRDQRRAFSSLVADSSSGVARLAQALLSDLAKRPAALTEVVLAFSEAGEQLGLVELDVLAAEARGTDLADAVRDLVLGQVHTQSDPRRANHLRVVELGLFPARDDLTDVTRTRRVRALVSQVQTDGRLALALLGSGSLNDQEAAQIRSKVQDLHRCPPQALVAFARTVERDDAVVDELRQRLKAEAFEHPQIALGWLELEQRIGSSDGDRRHLLDSFRVVTTVVSTKPELIAETVDLVTAGWLRLELVRWLTRLAIAADRDTRLRELVDATRALLERRRSILARHAQVALATSPETARRSGQALSRACAGRAAMKPIDAVALLATQKRDETVRTQAKECLRGASRVKELDAYARALSLVHPSALTVVATLQPQTRQPLRRLVQELDLRAPDDDLCTAELLDLLDRSATDLELSATMHARRLELALRQGQRWIADGKEAPCVPAARAAVRLTRTFRRLDAQLGLAAVLQKVAEEGQRPLRVSAYEAWDLLDPLAQHQFPLVAARRPRPPADGERPVRSSGTAFAGVEPAITLRWSSAASDRPFSASPRGSTDAASARTSDASGRASRLAQRPEGSEHTRSRRPARPWRGTTPAVPRPAPDWAVRHPTRARLARARAWVFPLLGLVVAVLAGASRGRVVRTAGSRLDHADTFAIGGASVVTAITRVAELSSWPTVVVFALPAVTLLACRRRSPELGQSLLAASTAALLAAIPAAAVVLFFVIMAANVVLALVVVVVKVLAVLVVVALGLLILGGSSSK